MRAKANTRLRPYLTERLHALCRARGWPRAMALRRLIAFALVALAGVLALRPASAQGEPTARIVVAAHDLAPGVTLSGADVAVRSLPAALLPRGALADAAAAVGHVIAGGVRAGEPLTDVRLLGRANTILTAGDPAAAAVPVRLADPDVAELLRPGSKVDVVTLDPDRQGDPVVAEDAVVLTVRAAGRDPSAGPLSGSPQGRLVVLALPRQAATRVAAASLNQPMTVTLR